MFCTRPFDSLRQDCGNSSDALELPQSCTKHDFASTMKFFSDNTMYWYWIGPWSSQSLYTFQAEYMKKLSHNAVNDFVRRKSSKFDSWIHNIAIASFFTEQPHGLMPFSGEFTGSSFFYDVKSFPLEFYLVWCLMYNSVWYMWNPQFRFIWLIASIPELTYGTIAHRYDRTYCKTSNIRRTLVGNKIVDHSDVVGASPVGAAPTTSSFST